MDNVILKRNLHSRFLMQALSLLKTVYEGLQIINLLITDHAFCTSLSFLLPLKVKLFLHIAFHVMNVTPDKMLINEPDYLRV